MIVRVLCLIETCIKYLKDCPFIIYDNDPYMVVHNGRLVWMIDGYTTSKFFPYSTPFDRKINYIRNSVIVTVDAYSGETHFLC